MPRPSPSRRLATHNSELVTELDEDLDDERGPLRRCVVTRVQGERARMLRFCIAPDRTVVPDLAAKLPGRGIWLSARADVIQTACARGAFARAARGAVTLPPDLCSALIAGLTRRVVDHFGLARRAGQAVCGFQKAREVLVAGRAALVVQAADGSVDERQRFLSGVRRSGARGVIVVRPISAAELGVVFGRDHVVHAVITPGRLAATLAVDVGRLAGVSGQPGMMMTIDDAPKVAVDERNGE